MAISAAATERKKLDVLDRRTPPVVRDPGADLAWLRWYQREAVDKVVAKARGILHLPTGAGKTEIAVGIVRALPCRWLFLVHRTQLAIQTAERYELRAREHAALGTYAGPMRAGVVTEGEWRIPPGARFICATFQTVFDALARGDDRAKKLMEGAEGFFVDEAHTLPAGTFYSTILPSPAYFRVGLSATPMDRTDARSLYVVAATGPIIYRIKPDVLIAEGVLAKPTIHMVSCLQTADSTTWAGVYAKTVTASTKRNRLITEMARRAPKPAFVFVKHENHGRAVSKLLSRAGVSNLFVFGEHDTPARQAALDQLRAGALDALVCTSVFQEGIDVPELRSVVNASGGKSVIEALQKLGRGMRVMKGADGTVLKDTFDAYDVADGGCGCDKSSFRGDRHDGCRWLERHTRERRTCYVREGFTVLQEEWALPGLLVP